MKYLAGFALALSISTPAFAQEKPFTPQAVVTGGLVVPLYPPDSPLLKKERLGEAEVVTLSTTVAGRINSIVNVHNPTIEVHRAGGNNTGAAVIVVPGGGHNNLVIGSEGADFVPFFFNYGVNTVILRYRLRKDGYVAEVDAVNDMLQAIKLVRANAAEWGIDPKKIGAMGFSAGAELTAPAAINYPEFDKTHDVPGNPLAKVSSRPDFVGVIYPGPSPFRDGKQAAIPDDAPPAFLASAGVGDAVHAVWADEFFAAFLKARIPNLDRDAHLRQRRAWRRPDRSRRQPARHLAVPLHRVVPGSRVSSEGRRGDESGARRGRARGQTAGVAGSHDAAGQIGAAAW